MQPSRFGPDSRPCNDDVCDEDFARGQFDIESMIATPPANVHNTPTVVGCDAGVDLKLFDILRKRRTEHSLERARQGVNDVSLNTEVASCTGHFAPDQPATNHDSSSRITQFGPQTLGIGMSAHDVDGGIRLMWERNDRTRARRDQKSVISDGTAIRKADDAPSGVEGDCRYFSHLDPEFVQMGGRTQKDIRHFVCDQQIL